MRVFVVCCLVFVYAFTIKCEQVHIIFVIYFLWFLLGVQFLTQSIAYTYREHEVHLFLNYEELFEQFLQGMYCNF